MRDDMLNNMSVLTFGEPLIVCAHIGSESLGVNRNFQMDSAGAELNTAIALARLNVPTTYAAALGADPFGDFLIRELRAERVNVSKVEQVDAMSTGILFKMTSGLQADPNVYYYRSQTPMAMGQWTGGDCVREVSLGRYSWVHATGIVWMLSDGARAHAQEIFQAAYENGIPVSFDINVRLKMADKTAWKKTLVDVIPFVRWLMIGDTEAQLLFDTDDIKQIADILLQLGFRGEGFVLKQGERGATAFKNGQEILVAAWPVARVVDTVGAGDGFNAGFIAGILKGWSMEQSLKLASLIGAHAVASVGDSSGYPAWSSVERYFTGDEEVAR